MDSNSDMWHLYQDSTLTHTFHAKEEVCALLLNTYNPNNKQLNTMNHLFDNRIAPSTMVRVMTEAVHLSTQKKG